MARDLSRSDQAAAGIGAGPSEAPARLAAAPRHQPRVGRFLLAVVGGAVLLMMTLACYAAYRRVGARAQS